MKAFIFPGQGSQFPGMGYDLYQTSKKAKNLFEKANEILDFNISKIMFEGTEGELKKLPKFDHILLFGILHHLDDEEVNNLLRITKKVLKREGNIITEDPILVDKQNIFSKFIIKMDRGSNVRNKKEYTNLIKKFFKKIDSKIYHQTFIPYTWFVMNCKK